MCVVEYKAGCSFCNNLAVATYALDGLGAHAGHDLLDGFDMLDVLGGLDVLGSVKGLEVLDGLEVFDGLKVYDQLLPNGLADPLGMELLEL